VILDTTWKENVPSRLLGTSRDARAGEQVPAQVQIVGMGRARAATRHRHANAPRAATLRSPASPPRGPATPPRPTQSQAWTPAALRRSARPRFALPRFVFLAHARSHARSQRTNAPAPRAGGPRPGQNRGRGGGGSILPLVYIYPSPVCHSARKSLNLRKSYETLIFEIKRKKRMIGLEPFAAT